MTYDDELGWGLRDLINWLDFAQKNQLHKLTYKELEEFMSISYHNYHEQISRELLKRKSPVYKVLTSKNEKV